MVVDDAPLAPDLVATALPGILSRARVVVTPYPFNVSGADKLRVVSVNSVPGVVVEIHGRAAAPGVDAKPFRFTHVPNSDRTTRTEDFEVGEGFVTNMTAFVTGATPQLSQTYVIIHLIRSAGATAFLMGTLVAGPVTSTQPLGWPGSPLQSSFDGPGAIRNIVGTTPAAGVEINETVPDGARWEFLSFIALFNSTPAGVTRLPILFSSKGGQLGFVAPQSSGPSTITTTRFGWQSGYGLNLGLVGANIITSLPVGYPLVGGTTVQSSTTGLSANDTWGSVNYTVREWLEVP